MPHTTPHSAPADAPHGPAATVPAATADLVQALRARLQADGGPPVELIETHISWVLLAGERAYKIKKPVRLPFVDFGTLAARRHFCEEELRLNRRLAPALYLGVLPITGTAAAPELAGAGAPIEYALCMRRFAPGALLSEQLAAGTLAPEALDDLAERLGRFHQQAAVARPGGDWGSAEQIEQTALRVLAQLQDSALAPAPTRDCAALAHWLRSQLPRLRPRWAERLQAGAVREGHGDLHLANTVLSGQGATAFDCLEFDPALRWIDVMNDLAFLTMDLHARARPDLAARVLDRYLQQTGDYAGLGVLRFYEVCRALVRALVARLSPPAAGAPDYLACAQRLSQPAPGGARLLITLGLSGAGKSTVAAGLLAPCSAVRLRSDVERKRLFGLDAQQSSRALGLDLYSADATRRTFEHLAAQAEQALVAGWPVIVDAAFLRREERERFHQLACRLGLPFGILHCHCDAAQLRARVQARQARGDDASEATLAVLAQQLQRPHGPDADEQAWVLPVDTGQALDAAGLAALAARWQALTAD